LLHLTGLEYWSSRGWLVYSAAPDWAGVKQRPCTTERKGTLMNMDNSKRGRGQAIKSGGFALPPSSVCSPCSRLPSAGGGRGLICAWPSSFASVFQSRQAIEAALGSGLKESVVWVNAVQFKSYPVRLDIFLQSRDQEEAVLAVLQRKRWQLGLDRVKIHENYLARRRKEGLPGD